MKLASQCIVSGTASATASVTVNVMSRADLPWVLATEASLHFAPWTEVNFTDSIDAGHELWILRRAQENLGYAVVLKVLDEAHLLNISIEAGRQGQGLGRFFLNWLHQHAKAAGAACFLLEVRASNLAAQALYRRLGYGEIGRRRRYYAAAGGREDAIVMKCVLAPVAPEQSEACR